MRPFPVHLRTSMQRDRHTHTHTAKHADFLGCNVNAGEDRKRGLLDQQRRFPRAIDFVNYRDRSKHGRAVYGFHI